jgi:hypothetical protein
VVVTFQRFNDALLANALEDDVSWKVASKVVNTSHFMEPLSTFKFHELEQSEDDGVALHAACSWTLLYFSWGEKPLRRRHGALGAER